ncbi:MAG: glycine dehydrogenase, partial [Actinomycetota bacterium]
MNPTTLASSLSSLFSPSFHERHIGIRHDEIADMLAVIGASSVDDLIERTIPDSILRRGPLALPDAISEPEVTAELRALAASNRARRSFIGLGYAQTITPPVIKRNVLENPAWYTSYTPYQPEISQGRLETLLNFQTMVVDLTGLPVANASLLDEATAASEAMTMAKRIGRSSSDRFYVDADTHPQTINVMRTRAIPLGIELVVGGPLDASSVYGALLSYPTSTGRVVDWRGTIDELHSHGAVAVVATDPLACVLLASPGSLGADIAIGSAQRFGVPMGFGGPHAAFMATRDSHARTLPGRLVGVSTDAAGRPALRLALQTREQHIRREKATSNICTAQALLANIAGLYASWHGPDGLRRIAARVNRLADVVAAALVDGGYSLVHDTWFDTITFVDATGAAGDAARRAGFDLRHVDATTFGITLDEATTLDEVCALLRALGVDVDVDGLSRFDARLIGMPAELLRDDEILTAPAFNSFHTEHEMLRYLRRLADRDLALDRTMIPLGSCTMKLNATTEMEPITWSGFADIHPFAPADESEGYRRLVTQLEQWLCEITGYDAVSLQPNAGSQGELAGLLAIRAYHLSRGDTDRTVCLIPSSAHGTNAASAVMAGMRVVVVACDDQGNVDLDDLRRHLETHGERVAAIMVTYPSTHGVFEDGIVELCRLVHEVGG